MEQSLNNNGLDLVQRTDALFKKNMDKLKFFVADEQEYMEAIKDEKRIGFTQRTAAEKLQKMKDSYRSRTDKGSYA